MGRSRSRVSLQSPMGAAFVCLFATLLAETASAQDPIPPIGAPDVTRAARRAPRIRPGAWEFAMGASFNNTNGHTQGVAEVRGGTFFPGGAGLVGVETMLGYSKLGSTDYGDAELGVSWQRPVTLEFTGTGIGGVWPYATLAGGVSQAWGVGFEDTRYPVGMSFGARLLQGRGTAARFEYRFRHYLGVETGNYTLSGWFVGVSFLINNREPGR